VGTKISDKGLSHLAGFQNLQALHLHHTGVSELRELPVRKSLKELSLRKSKMTDSGLKSLSKTQQLE
jgi:hypothetical protein